MRNKAFMFIDEIAICPDAPQISESPPAPSQVFHTTTAERPSATNAAEVNTDSKADANPGRKWLKEGTQVELDTVVQRNNEPENAEHSRESTQSRDNNPKDQDKVEL